MIVNSFSGGRSSALMTVKYASDIIIFANTGKEREETLQFVQQTEEYLNKQIVWLEYCPMNSYKIVNYKTANRNGKPFADLIEKKKYLPNPTMRFCTSELKIRPMKKYLQSIGLKNWTYNIGIRRDEGVRYAKMMKNDHKEPYYYDFPLYYDNYTKLDVLQFWKNMPYDLQIPGDWGNCDLCFMKGVNKLAKLIKEEPNRANWWIEQENKIEATFRKNVKYKDILKLKNQQSIDFTTCFCVD